jgi:hypothetical protein
MCWRGAELLRDGSTAMVAEQLDLKVVATEWAA